MMRKSLFIGYLLVYVFSASVNYFFVKFGLKYATPLGYMAIRYAIAGSLLAIATMTINGKYYLILNRDLALLSLFSSLSSALAYGLLYIDPGSSAIFGYTMPPLFAIPLSILLIREKPRT
ncbi:EamA family transporter [Vulcanisaeta souniana]|uniref:EamA family transporter n=1 Tax=Vulcanisaeta souniana TaxID=164452 RepID=UPI001FB38258|nr:EamA family transporter [Vulcanisaeta souniana]